jgi:hypothetical protein
MEEVVLCQIITPKRIYAKCEHGKRKSRCIICGGSEICQHNISKFKCITCNPQLICLHNKRKQICILCKGSEICEHNKRKSQCLSCHGREICEHNKIKRQCIVCKGTQICEHNKRKSRCIVCGGNEICSHNMTKRICKLCNGKEYCIHNKLKRRCVDCCGKDLCISCKLTLKSKKYNNHCFRCFIYLFPTQSVTRNYKTKESATSQFITNNFPNFTWNLDKKVEDGCSKRRPDLMCDLGYQVIIVEIDENQHDNYDCSCENKRIMQISQDLNHRPIVFIRFNPDDYTNANNEKITSCWGLTPKTGILKIKSNKNDEWNERLTVLQSQIEYWCNETNKTEKTIEIVQLYYDGFQ